MGSWFQRFQFVVGCFQGRRSKAEVRVEESLVHDIQEANKVGKNQNKKRPM